MLINHQWLSNQKGQRTGVRTALVRQLVQVPLKASSQRREKHRLVSLMVRASASRVTDLVSVPPFGVDLFPGRDIPVTEKMVPQWLPCQAPGVIESALGRFGPVSVNCD